MARSKRRRARTPGDAVDWTRLYRLYVATHDETFLDRAIAACADARVRELLEGDGTNGNGQERLQSTYSELAAEGRPFEAAALMILAGRSAAMQLRAAAERSERSVVQELRDELRQATRREDVFHLDYDGTLARRESELDAAEEICSVMLDVSRSFGFLECQAFFLLAIGIRKLHAQHWIDAQLTLVEAANIYQQLEFESPGLYAHDAMLSFQHAGEVLLQVRRFRHAYDLTREAERMLALLAQLSASFEPARLRVASLTGRALIGLRRFGAAAEKLHDVFYAQRNLALQYRDEFAFDVCRTGTALATAMLQRASSPRTGQQARDIADLTLLTLRSLARHSGMHIYGAAHADAHYALGWACVQLGKFKKAKSELATAEAYCFMERHQPEIYHAKQAAIHHRRAQALAGEARFDRALSELAKARELFETAPRGEAERIRLDYAAVLDEMADVYHALGDATRCIDHADLAVWEAELACRDHLSTAFPDADEAAGEDDARHRRMVALGLTMEPADPALSHLSKGVVARSYSYLAAHRLRTSGGEGLFHVLSAQRDGAVFATFTSVDDVMAAEPGVAVARRLENAADALRAVEQRTGRRLSVVIAQNLGEHDAIVGVLGSEPPYLTCVHEAGLRRALDGLPRELQRVFVAGATSADEWRRRIAAAGVRSWNRLPPSVRAVLDPTAGGDVLISGDPYWAAYPWEGLFSPAWEFVGTHRPLVRWTPITAAALSALEPLPLGNGSASAAVISPWNVRGQARLPASRREAEAVAATLSARGCNVAAEQLLVGDMATAGGLFESLSSTHAVVHYAGHGVIDGNEELLALHRDGLSPRTGQFGGAHIDLGKERIEHDDALLASRPLVTLSACLAGRVRTFGGMREDLVWKLLAEGAGAVIASPHPVFDEATAALGPLLYEPAPAPRESLAQTFARVRSQLERESRSVPTWPMWLFLTYHGNPFAFLPDARTTTSGELQ